MGEGVRRSSDHEETPEYEKTPEVKREIANLLEAMVKTPAGGELLKQIQSLRVTPLGEIDWRKADLQLPLGDLGFLEDDSAKIVSMINLRGPEQEGL